MKNGGMRGLIYSSVEEKIASGKLNYIDEKILALREKVRAGEIINNLNFEIAI